jgi:hypothetical protein
MSESGAGSAMGEAQSRHINPSAHRDLVCEGKKEQADD